VTSSSSRISRCASLTKISGFLLLGIGLPLPLKQNRKKTQKIKKSSFSRIVTDENSGLHLLGIVFFLPLSPKKKKHKTYVHKKIYKKCLEKGLSLSPPKNRKHKAACLLYP
jgi:hypothetical protein